VCASMINHHWRFLREKSTTASGFQHAFF
jgi:hypothetical protein